MWKVYIVKTEDGRMYIGCTSTSLKARLAVHKYQKKEFAKGSVEIVLETQIYDEASDLEARLIREYSTTDIEHGYNRRFGDSRYGFPDYVYKKIRETKLSLGGSSGERNAHWGKKHSDEAKDKIRQKALQRAPSTFEKNRHKTPEQIEKLLKGRDEHRKKFGHPMKGRKHTEESRKKMSDSQKLSREIKKLKSSSCAV